MFKTFLPVRQAIKPHPILPHAQKSHSMFPSIPRTMQPQRFVPSENKKIPRIVKPLANFSKMYHKQNPSFNTFNKQINDLRKEIIKFNRDNHRSLTRIAKVNEEELGRIVDKIDETANSRLTMFAAYATILSLLLALLIFLYQQQQEQEKERLEDKLKEDKLRSDVEKTQMQIEKILLQYSGLLTTKKTIIDNIEHLEKHLKTLYDKKNQYWFNFMVPNSIEMGIIKLQGDIDSQKVALQLTINKINKLDLYVLKQKELEEAEVQKAETAVRSVKST